MIDVSIIILSFNAKNLLIQCLESLYAIKTNKNIEIIVVDNDSKDGSPDMVREKFPNVKLIENNKNLGFAKGNNIGIKESSGKYVCLINSDIIVSPDCLDQMIDYMEVHPSIGILSPKLLKPDMTLSSNCRKFPTTWNYFCVTFGINKIFKKSNFFSSEEMLYFDHNEIRKVEVIAGAFWLVRKISIQEVGLLDKLFFFYAEDSDWCKRFWNAGWYVVFYPLAYSIHYHMGSSPITSEKLYIQRYRSKLQYWKKHHGTFGVINVIPIIIINQFFRIILYTFYYFVKPSQRKSISVKITLFSKCILWLLGLIKVKEYGKW